MTNGFVTREEFEREMAVYRSICMWGWGNATLAHPSPWSDELEEMARCWACGKPVVSVERNPAANARQECGRCGAH